MSILFDASFTSYYVHIVLNHFHSFPSPSPFFLFNFFLFAHPFSFTVHLTIVHNMIQSQTVARLGTELLIGKLQPNQCWCHCFTPNECPAIMALHSSSELLLLLFKTKKFPRENAIVNVSLELTLYLGRRPDKFLVLFLYEGNRLHGVQFSGVCCFLFSLVHFSVHLSIPLILQFYP